MPVIHIGNTSHYLNLTIHGRTKPGSQDYWDANWLHCTADASTDALHESIDWQLRNEDLTRFLRGLERLGEAAGEALLDTGDGWLDVRVIRDEGGKLNAQCQLVDNTGSGHTLEFELPLNPTILCTIMGQLRAVLEQFPVVGQ